MTNIIYHNILAMPRQSVYNHDRNNFKLVKVQRALAIAMDDDVRQVMSKSTSIDCPTLFSVGLD